MAEDHAAGSASEPGSCGEAHHRHPCEVPWQHARAGESRSKVLMLRATLKALCLNRFAIPSIHTLPFLLHDKLLKPIATPVHLTIRTLMGGEGALCCKAAPQKNLLSELLTQVGRRHQAILYVQKHLAIQPQEYINLFERDFPHVKVRCILAVQSFHTDCISE